MSSLNLKRPLPIKSKSAFRTGRLMFSVQGSKKPSDLLRGDLALCRHHLLLPPWECSLLVHLPAPGQHWPWCRLLYNAHNLRCFWPLLYGLQKYCTFAWDLLLFSRDVFLGWFCIGATHLILKFGPNSILGQFSFLIMTLTPHAGNWSVCTILCE